MARAVEEGYRALEALYLDGDSDKGRLVARRGASFVGSDAATRAIQYRQLRAVYKARNAIMHDGFQSPAVSVQRQIADLPALLAAGFDHVGAAIQKILQTPTPIAKAVFLGSVKTAEAKLDAELGTLDTGIGAMPVTDR
jgi:hypothetical protein